MNSFFLWPLALTVDELRWRSQSPRTWSCDLYSVITRFSSVRLTHSSTKVWLQTIRATSVHKGEETIFLNWWLHLLVCGPRIQNICWNGTALIPRNIVSERYVNSIVDTGRAADRYPTFCYLIFSRLCGCAIDWNSFQQIFENFWMIQPGWTQSRSPAVQLKSEFGPQRPE